MGKRVGPLGSGAMWFGGEERVRSGPVSRVLSRAAIYLGPASPRASSALPERSAGHTMALLHAFAPEGACQAAVLPRRWWSLTPPFQLFSHPQSGQRESSFLRRFPSGYPARPLTCFLPCGARTFLMTCKHVPRSPGPPRACHCITLVCRCVTFSRRTRS